MEAPRCFARCAAYSTDFFDGLDPSVGTRIFDIIHPPFSAVIITLIIINPAIIMVILNPSLVILNEVKNLVVQLRTGSVKDLVTV
jgi:hypothetical protein